MPLNEDGTFSSMNCLGTWHAGRDYLDFCDHIARRAWRVGDRDALDWMWYLWIGFNSPASGRLVRTFERAYIADKSTWIEPMDPYFTLTKSPSVCDDIMREFGVAPMACSPTGHIINGHTPVKTTKGEQPIRANGKLLVIDGGFCRAYHPKQASPATRSSRARADAASSRTRPLPPLPRRSPAISISRARPTALTRPTAAAW